MGKRLLTPRRGKKGKPRSSGKKAKEPLSASLEDYLEAISLLGYKGQEVRVKDIGRSLRVKNPSVVSALNVLCRNGLVSHQPYGKVQLTAEGRVQAREILKKHRALVIFLREILGLDAGTAEADACRLEHVVSPLTLQKITSLVARRLRSQ